MTPERLLELATEIRREAESWNIERSMRGSAKQYRLLKWADELAALVRGAVPPAPQEVKLGVIEFHSEKLNPGLIRRFYEVRDDLTAAGCIVDLWLHDIAAVLREFGYDMRIYGSKLPAASQGPAPARTP